MKNDLHRRQFIASIALAGCGAAFARAAAGSGFRLRYLLESAMYGNLPLATVLPEVKKAGATSIDLWPKVHGAQREEMDALGHDKFAEMLREQGITLGCITRYDLGPFKLGDEILVAKKFGAPLLVCGGAGNYKVPADRLKAQVADFVEKLKPHAAKAAEHGVTLAIENHGHNLIDSPDSLRWLVEMAVPGMGIALAPYHLPQDPKLIAALIRDLGPKLSLFYGWEFGVGCSKPMPKEEELKQMPGRGSLDFKPVIAALAEIRFSGPTEIMMHPTPRGFPILETAEKVTAEINRSREYLDGLAAAVAAEAAT